MDTGSWSWKRRLAAVLTALWIAFIYAVSENERAFFVTAGLLLPGLLWGVAWVIAGARRNKPNPGSTVMPSVAPQLPANQRSSYTSGWRTAGWAVIIAVFAGMLYYAATEFGPTRAGEHLAQMLGALLVVALVAFAMKRVFVDHGKAVFCAAMFFAVVQGIQIQKLREEVSLREQVVAQATLLANRVEASNAAAAGQKPATPPASSVAPSASSPAASEGKGRYLSEAEFLLKFGKIVEDLAAEYEATRARDAEELEALRLENILRPASPIEVANNASRMASVDKADAILKRQREGDRQRQLAMQRRVAELNLSPADRIAVDVGMKRTMTETQALSDRNYTASHESLEKIRQILRFTSSVASAKGLDVRNGQLVFAYEGDLKTYQTMFSELEVLVTREEAVGREMTAYRTRSAQGFKSSAESLGKR